MKKSIFNALEIKGILKILCTLYFGFVPESCTKVIAFLFKRHWRKK